MFINHSFFLMSILSFIHKEFHMASFKQQISREQSPPKRMTCISSALFKICKTGQSGEKSIPSLYMIHILHRLVIQFCTIPIFWSLSPFFFTTHGFVDASCKNGNLTNPHPSLAFEKSFFTWKLWLYLFPFWGAWRQEVFSKLYIYDWVDNSLFNIT